MSRTRFGAVALAVAAVMFVLYPALRPWADETTAAGATASMSSTYWVLSHFFAMIGFILAPLGILALRDVTGAARLQAAFVTTSIGAGLVLPYYGAEDFGLHAAAARGVPDLLGFADAVRYNPIAVTIFGVGLILLAIGGVLTAIAIWPAARAAAIAYGLGMALFLPQFFTPAAVRIGHGIVLGAGCALLAVTLGKSSASGTAGARLADGEAGKPGAEQPGIMAG